MKIYEKGGDNIMPGFINDGDTIKVDGGELTVRIRYNRKSRKRQILLYDKSTTYICTVDKNNEVYMAELPPLSTTPDTSNFDLSGDDVE